MLNTSVQVHWSLPLSEASQSSEEDEYTSYPSDYVAFVLCCIVTVAMASTNVYLALNRKRYIIKRKAPGMMIALSFFGSIWLWSTFVSGEHLEMLLEFRRAVRCTVWDFWMQYLFGQTLWMCIVILRLNQFYCIYRNRSPRRSGRVLFLICFVPMAIVCSMVEYATSWQQLATTASSDSLSQCTTDIEWKIALIACITLEATILLVQIYRVRGIRKTSSAFAWYDEVSHFVRGAFVAFVMFFVGIVIVLGDYGSSVWGRFAFTCMVLICTTYFYFSVLWKAIRINCSVGPRYVNEFEPFMRDTGARAFMFDWLRNAADTVEIDTDYEESGGGGAELRPIDIANAYTMLSEHRTKVMEAQRLGKQDPLKASAIQEATQLKKKFLDRYVEANSATRLPLSDYIRQLDSNSDEIIEQSMRWLLDTLERHYWKPFCQDSDSGLLAYFRQLSQDPESTEHVFSDEDRQILLQHVNKQQ